MNRLLSRSILGASLVALLVAPVAPVMAAPGNDDITTPIVIPSFPYSNAQDTADATTGPTDPDCFGTGPTVWYAYTAAEDATLAATTFGSDYDTTLYVGTPDGADGIDLIDCNDDAGKSVQSAIRFHAEAGVTYLFMVGAFAGGPGGSLVFTLDLAPPPFDVSVTVDATGRVDRYGGATISGTISCSAEGHSVVSGGLSQRVGRFSVRGSGHNDVAECSPVGTPWTLHVTSSEGKFAGGAVTAYVFAFACDDYSCAETFMETTVRLRR
jgi:hypothetical protein